jgi:hypothetical protein
MRRQSNTPGGAVNPWGLRDRDRRGELFYHTRDIAEGVSTPAFSPFLVLSQRLGAAAVTQTPPRSVDNFQGRMQPAAAGNGSQP